MPSSTEAGAFMRWAVVDEEIRDLGEAMPDENTGSDSITIAIPVSQLISLPVLVPVDDRTVAEGVAMTELEDLGTRTPLTGSQISHAGYIPYSQNGTDPQRGWGYGLTVVPALPEGEDIHYAPSPLLLELPEDGVAIWKEFGQLVAAWTSEGHLRHCSPLSSGRPDSNLAHEIITITRRLSEDGHLGCWPMIRLFGSEVADEADADFSRIITEATENAPAFKEALRPCFPTDPLPPIVPEALAARLAARRRISTILLATSSFLVVLILGLLFLAGATRLSEARLNDRQAWLNENALDVERIRSTRERWQSMAGALEPEEFPIELLYQCVLLMPESGVRLTDFEFGNGKLAVSGVATTARQALAYRDQFDREGPLAVFRWKLPVPNILRDGQASFRAEGENVYANDDI